MHETNEYGMLYNLHLDCGHFEHRFVTFQSLRESATAPDFGDDVPCGTCYKLDKLKQRAGDQPLPIHNDEPFCHDQVVKLIESVWPLEKQLIADVLSRKELGITRYGRALQPRNGRDFLQDLYEELLDASAYAQGCSAENILSVTDYITILRLARRIRKLMNLRGSLKKVREAQRERLPKL
jgi:hypothetical protein